MAAASPSPLVSSVEKTNGAKLSRLLIDGGTMVLRKIFDRYHPPANLLADLNANYHTLNNLLRRRVLHKPQWDLLFPPGGATPDSNTFDITLLFFLLTSICGLSPPPLGWHTKPLPSDTSVEANLARIKFFRNELYGHVTTTGIDTPTFSALWLELGAVLVALGLPQAEINRLKAEHCGEEEFIDVLFEWAESEEDIKSQLKDIRQYQAKTGQTVDEVRQTQLEDQKTMQDIKAMVEDVLDFQSVAVTQKTIDEKRHTQLGDRETVRENKVDKKLQDHVEVQRGKSREIEMLKKLARIETLKSLRYHADKYVEGTSLSIFSKVDRWLNDRSSPNRVIVISGNAGMGKSVISAVMCEKMQEAGQLAGCHFCQHDKARHRNPKVMLQSLASQLCDFLPDYKKALVEKLSRNLGVEINNMEVKDLFEVLFEEPLTSLNDPGLTYLMVIDGLDESEFQGRNELLDVIANFFQGLPLPKKGNLLDCSNWRGITLLPLASKVLSRILINRIQTGVDSTLRKEQAGFRRGRGTVDQIFILRNILEQANEWNATLYIHFVDFEKAFDSVHRVSLWTIMKKYGIPQKLIQMVKTLYQDFQCAVIDENETTDCFPVRTGVKQGCCMSGLLFLLIIDWVMRQTVEGERTGIRWNFTTMLEDLDFADDIALLSSTMNHIQRKTTNLEENAARVGLKLNARKCKILKSNSKSDANLTVSHSDVEEVDSFMYLGANVTKDGGSTADMKKRIGLASSTFNRLSKIWTATDIGRKTKVSLFKSLVLSVLLYGCETWKLTKREENKLDVFQTRCLRRMFKIRWQQRVTNKAVLEMAGAEKISDEVRRRRWSWIGHVLRKEPTHDCAVALGWAPEGKRKRGRPKTTWRRMVEVERNQAGWQTWGEARRTAADRPRWKRDVRALCASWH